MFQRDDGVLTWADGSGDEGVVVSQYILEAEVIGVAESLDLG